MFDFSRFQHFALMNGIYNDESNVFCVVAGVNCSVPFSLVPDADLYGPSYVLETDLSNVGWRFLYRCYLESRFDE